MDPNEALRQARQAADTLAEVEANEDPAVLHHLGTHLAEVFTGLDEWIVKGGFLPKGWEGPLTTTMAGNWTDNVRAIHRLETAFDRAIRDDERANRTLEGEATGSGLRAHLVRLLAREVIEEVNRERAKVEEMTRSEVTRQFMDSAAARLAKAHPQSIYLERDALASAGPAPGFTAEGWAKLQGIREQRGAEDDS